MKTLVSRPSLAKTITKSIALTAILAMIAQIIIVATRSYFAEQDLQIDFVTHQVALLKSSLVRIDGQPALPDTRIPFHYLSDTTGAYGFRILTRDGHVIAEHNAEMFRSVSPWPSELIAAMDLWIVNLERGKRLHVAGGVHTSFDKQPLLIEVGTRGDPDRTSFGILVSEIADDVWLPMIPLIVLTLGVAVISVRHALRPLADISALVERSAHPASNMNIDSRALPSEVAAFVEAINGLLMRVHDLGRSQRAFVARAAHELRTPLAAMMLEIEHVPARGTERLAADIADMSLLVDRLLNLARLEIKELAVVDDIDLSAIGHEVISRMEAIRLRTEHSIELRVSEPPNARGDVTAVREAMRNMIENAIRHTPPGTHIRVTVGPQSRICVEDDGPGWPSDEPDTLLEPFAKGASGSEGSGLGLSIVNQAAQMLGGTVRLGASRNGGARIEVVWDSAEIEDRPVATSVMGSQL